LFIDTGLAKGSLGIISQGTVQYFVESKPEDRRQIFEEAAGIGLYTKNKEESLKQLEKTQENLNRITDIVDELDRDVKKLSKQAEKAQIYNEKRKELIRLDVTILIKDLNFFGEKLKVIKKELEQSKTDLKLYEPDIKATQNSLQSSKQELDEADKQVEALTLQLTDIVGEINQLEIKKNTLINSLQKDIESDNVEKKLQAFKKIIDINTTELETNASRADQLSEEITVFAENLTSLTQQKQEFSANINSLSIKLAEIRMQIKMTNDSIADKSHLDVGSQTIIDNRQALSGICGIVRDLFNTEDQYKKAIYTALGKSIESIVVETTQDAKDAVNFLKRNKCGKTTFIPLDTIKPRNIKDEYLQMLAQKDLAINVGNELIQIDEKYTPAFSYLLGNVIIANNIDDALLVSKYTSQQFRIVTLDGDSIGAGGAVSGGYNKVNVSNINDLQQQLVALNDQYQQLDTELIGKKSDFDRINIQHNTATIKLNEKKILHKQYLDAVTTIRNQLSNYEADYQALLSKTKKSGSLKETTIDSIQEKLSSLLTKKDKITEQINIARQNKILYKSSVDDLEAKLMELRTKLDEVRNVIGSHETDQVRCEAIVSQAKTKISQTYKMTVEFAQQNYRDELPMTDNQAREAIIQLQNDIERLGAINMEAIEELGDKKQRLTELVSQKDELEQAKQKMQASITELDNKARGDFAKTIEQVNEMLPPIVHYLFGGGTCRVEYTNPDDILSSGIDVAINPPGKNVVNLNLLSGGEKTLVALCILFAILKNKTFPLIILDEAESALDPANVERFANIIRQNSTNTQFLVITHRSGTMTHCNKLHGATMQFPNKGTTSFFTLTIEEAVNKYSSNKEE
jgi:chromosome segregation protein